MDSCTTELPLRVNGIQPAFGIELGQAGPRAMRGEPIPIGKPTSPIRWLSGGRRP